MLQKEKKNSWLAARDVSRLELSATAAITATVAPAAVPTTATLAPAAAAAVITTEGVW